MTRKGRKYGNKANVYANANASAYANAKANAKASAYTNHQNSDMMIKNGKILSIKPKDDNYLESKKMIILRDELMMGYFNKQDKIHYKAVENVMTAEEYMDRKNVVCYIKKYYTGYVKDDECIENCTIKYDDVLYNIWYDTLYYGKYLIGCDKGTYIIGHDNVDIELSFCNRDSFYYLEEYDIDIDYSNSIKEYVEDTIDQKYHRYDKITGKWVHIKRLPDIKANINCSILKKSIKDIMEEKHYILENKFYWKYIYLNNSWVIKFYPNLHDDIEYLVDKVDRKLNDKRLLLNHNISILEQKLQDDTFQLLYLFSRLPNEMKDEIKKYL